METILCFVLGKKRTQNPARLMTKIGRSRGWGGRPFLCFLGKHTILCFRGKHNSSRIEKTFFLCFLEKRNRSPDRTSYTQKIRDRFFVRVCVQFGDCFPLREGEWMRHYVCRGGG
ncbi:unnamed protein product, partial [Laminaria digitata]